MSNGITCSSKDLGMPNGIDAVSQDTIGTTGMGVYITPYNKLKVLAYLQNLSWGEYKFDYWDCEDRAFWGIANARCQFKGLPIGAAIGKAIEGSFSKDEYHTLIVFWDLVGNNYTPVYFDPDESLRREVEFKPQIIIPFPPHRYFDKKAVRKELSPFEGYLHIERGYFALDNDYSIIDTGQIKKYLTGLAKCPDSADPLVYRFREDRAFYAFIHACREFKGSPIGVAFGKAKEGKYQNKDSGVVMLWKSCDEYVFWDVDDNKEVSFEPRIIIV